MERAGLPADSGGVLDLAVGQREAEEDAFTRWVRESCALRGLSCALLHQEVVDEARAALGGGELTVGVLLDLAAAWRRDDDAYTRLCFDVKDAGGRVIDDPDAARVAEHKAAVHQRLERSGLPVPPTVVLRRWTPDRTLTARERALVGDRVVIKPARGWARRGVVVGAQAELGDLAQARDFDRGDDFLVQRLIPHASLPDDEGTPRPAWWRVYHLFGELVPCWWSPDTSEYRLMSMRELWVHQLLPLLRLAGEVARLTGMDFFSTEICLAAEPAPAGTAYRAGDHPFYIIDYVNDQCDLQVQSRHPSGPPDEVVRHLADRFAELAWRHRHGLPLDGHRSFWLRRAPDGDPTL